VLAGVLVTLVAIGLASAGIAGIWADWFARDGAGYLSVPTVSLSTDSHAIATVPLNLSPASGTTRDLVGTLRISLTPTDPTRPVFAGVADAADVDRYLSGVDHVTVRELIPGSVQYQSHPGAGPSAAPDPADRIWVATTGSGTRDLTWTPRTGHWALVIANADGAPGVRVRVTVAATSPSLGRVSVALLTGGFLLAALGMALITTLTATGHPSPGARTDRQVAQA
jgi:hypothetical protein